MFSSTSRSAEALSGRRRPAWTTGAFVLGALLLSAVVPVVEAQDNTTSGTNETLGLEDPRIAYAPAFERWELRTVQEGGTYLRIREFSVAGDSDQVLTMANANLTFNGSALYYLSPVFNADIAVQVSIDGQPSDRLSLLDPSTGGEEGQEGGFEGNSGPSGTRTFLLADQLDVGREHVVQVTSDGGDLTSFLNLGQFMLTTAPLPVQAPADPALNGTDITDVETLFDDQHSGGPNLKLLIPLAVIVPLILLITITTGFCLWRRRIKAKRTAPSSSFLPYLNSQISTNRSGQQRSRQNGSTGPVPPLPPHGGQGQTHGRRGTEDSMVKDGDDDGEELGEYTVPATAFLSEQRKSPPMPYADFKMLNMSPGGPTTNAHPYATGGKYLQRTGQQPILIDDDDHSTSHQTSRTGYTSHGAHTSLDSSAPLIPAKLTQANLSQLTSAPSSVSSHPSQAHGGLRPPISVQHSPGRIGSGAGRYGQRHRDQQSVVSAANTAELLVRDIPYAPYLHTLAAPSEAGHNGVSRAGSRADSLQQQVQQYQLSGIREQDGQSEQSHGQQQRGGFFGPHIPSRFDTPVPPAPPKKDPFSSSSSSGHGHAPGLYPTYFGQADPTSHLPHDGGDNGSLGKLKPNRRRRSTEQGSGYGYGQSDAESSPTHVDPHHQHQQGELSPRGDGYDGAVTMSAPIPIPTPSGGLPPGAAAPSNPAYISSSLGSKRSLRRKAVPTIQELERKDASGDSSEGSGGLKADSSGESLHLPVQPRPPQVHHTADASYSTTSSVAPPPPAKSASRPLPPRQPRNQERERERPREQERQIQQAPEPTTTASTANLRPLPTRPRPLPSGPPPPSSDAVSAHSSHISPPPSSYQPSHTTAERPRPSGGRARSKERSGGGGGIAKQAGYDPVWYPDRLAS